MSDPPPTTAQHVVMFSGGVGSWAAAKRVATAHGTANLALLFTDTLMEDGDLYRFLVEGACDVFGAPRPADLLAFLRTVPEFHIDRDARRGMLAEARAGAAAAVPGLVWVAEGRDPWQVFRDERMLGNSQFDPCSKFLKRRAADSWLAAHRDPAATVCYVGIDWSEKHRYTTLAARKAAQGWRYEAPLTAAPYLLKLDFLAQCANAGLEPCAMYARGYAHANCGGFCIKAGQGHYATVLRADPDRYAFYEAQEEGMRAFLGRDVSVLADERGGAKKPLTLAALRGRLEAGAADQPGLFDALDIGGCGCFS